MLPLGFLAYVPHLSVHRYRMPAGIGTIHSSQMRIKMRLPQLLRTHSSTALDKADTIITDCTSFVKC